MEQGLCLPGSKVIIFYTENEGKKNESVNFKLLEIEDEGWLQWPPIDISLSQMNPFDIIILIHLIP